MQYTCTYPHTNTYTSKEIQSVQFIFFSNFLNDFYIWIHAYYLFYIYVYMHILYMYTCILLYICIYTSTCCILYWTTPSDWFFLLVNNLLKNISLGLSHWDISWQATNLKWIAFIVWQLLTKLKVTPFFTYIHAIPSFMLC